MKKRTPENAATFVKYEYDMFCHLAALLKSGIVRGLLSQIIYNSVLESFLIHTRNMCDFLYNKKNGDNICADDYMDKWTKKMHTKAGKSQEECKCNLCLDCPYTGRNYSRISKSLAHMSSERILYEIQGKVWDVGVISEEINKVWQHFWGSFPLETKKWFERDRAEVMAQLKKSCQQLE